jgi:hypothetical protein
LRPTFEKIFELQAHSLPIERLRINYENNLLFSVGHDGVLGMFEIKDRDPRQKKDKETF